MAIETPPLAQLTFFIRETTDAAMEMGYPQEKIAAILARAILVRYMIPDLKEPSPPKTMAERQREHRAKKKEQTPELSAIERAAIAARQRRYRAKKKQAHANSATEKG